MNTKTTHSPGPWNIEYSDAGKPRRIVDAAGEHVAYAHPSRYADGEQDPEAEGNILLMAAAPYFLAAMEQIQRLVNPGLLAYYRANRQTLGIRDAIDVLAEIYQTADAALARAKNEKPSP